MVFSDHEIEYATALFGLSKRETDIVRLLLDGVESKDAIAECLGISPGTVHTLLNRVFIKMQVHSKLGVALRMFNALTKARDADR